jgi:hypothetical protein
MSLPFRGRTKIEAEQGAGEEKRSAGHAACSSTSLKAQTLNNLPFLSLFPAPSPRRRLGARVSPDCPPISLQLARTAAGFDAEVIR